MRSYVMGTYRSAQGTREVVLQSVDPRAPWRLVDFVSGVTGPEADPQLVASNVTFDDAGHVADEYLEESRALGGPAWSVPWRPLDFGEPGGELE